MILILLVFQIFQALILGHDIEEFLVPLASMITYISYMFLANYIAQEIMDHNNDVFDTV